MPKTLDEILASLPKERQDAIAQRAADLQDHFDDEEDEGPEQSD